MGYLAGAPAQNDKSVHGYPASRQEIASELRAHRGHEPRFDGSGRLCLLSGQKRFVVHPLDAIGSLFQRIDLCSDAAVDAMASVC